MGLIGGRSEIRRADLHMNAGASPFGLILGREDYGKNNSSLDGDEFCARRG
jgi:hypothetical protein